MIDYDFRDTPDLETLIRLLVAKGYTYAQAQDLLKKYEPKTIEWLLQGGN